MNRDLVVIIDDEAKQTLRSLGNRYFINVSNRRQEYFLETPLGDIRPINGYLVSNPNLAEHTGEYLYLELTAQCHFRCPGCGVLDNLETERILFQPVQENSKYMTLDFALGLSEAIKDNPRMLGRNLFYGGGEPLIAPAKFAAVNSVFSKLDRTSVITITNGLPIPLEYSQFLMFLGKISAQKPTGEFMTPHTFLSLSSSHIGQYALWAKKENLSGYIPQDASSPQEVLFRKAEILTDLFQSRGLGFTINVIDNIGGNVSNDLRESVMRNLPIFETTSYGHREPCSQGQELAIRSNGDLYPHCYDVFNRTNKLGTIGFLLNN